MVFSETMNCRLRGGPLSKGDRILVHTDIGTNGEATSVHRLVEVDYLLPSYGKIIVRHLTDDYDWIMLTGADDHAFTTYCLYYSQEDYVWSRIAPGEEV
jgi:hypothetical protein